MLLKQRPARIHACFTVALLTLTFDDLLAGRNPVLEKIEAWIR